MQDQESERKLIEIVGAETKINQRKVIKFTLTVRKKFLSDIYNAKLAYVYVTHFHTVKVNLPSSSEGDSSSGGDSDDGEEEESKTNSGDEFEYFKGNKLKNASCNDDDVLDTEVDVEIAEVSLFAIFMLAVLYALMYIFNAFQLVASLNTAL